MEELERLRQKCLELEAEIKAMQEKEEEWPKKGDLYFVIVADGGKAEVLEFRWESDASDEDYRDSLNIFRTREEAELELVLRRMRFGKRWVPKSGEGFWYWSAYDENAIEATWSDRGWDLVMLAIGNVHKTREEAEAWGEEYSKIFISLPKVLRGES